MTTIQVYDFANAQPIRGPGGHPMQVPKPSMTAVERAALEHEKRKALFRDRLGPQPADLYADMAETERGPRPYHLSTFNAPLGSPLPSIAEVCAEQDRISRSLSERGSRSHSGLAAEALETERRDFLARTYVHTSHLVASEIDQFFTALAKLEVDLEEAEMAAATADKVIVGDHDPEWRARW